MRNNMFKAICVFTLVFLVLSMTGAAACNKCVTKTDAKNDAYTCGCSKCCFSSVLKNDKGCNLKVTTCGTITTKCGNKVSMSSNGKFCYTKKVACSCKTDSFKYCVKGTKGTDCATVYIKNTCSSCSSC